MSHMFICVVRTVLSLFLGMLDGGLLKKNYVSFLFSFLDGIYFCLVFLEFVYYLTIFVI